jgi:hypothetical protein
MTDDLPESRTPHHGSDVADNRARLQALGELVLDLSVTMSVDLFALVLIGPGGTVLLEGVSTEEERDAIAQAIDEAADHMRQVVPG